MIRRPAMLAVATMLAGCVAPPGGGHPASAPAAQAPGRCDAAKAQRLVGRPATPRTIAAARLRSGAATVRTIMPGEMVTMDYRADRLSVTTGPRGVVTAVRCG